MPAEPTPQMVAEARVEYVILDQLGGEGYEVRAGPFFLCPVDVVWTQRPCYFRSEVIARSALLRAQEASGCYARPEGATCGCVDMARVKIRSFQPSAAIESLTPTDREWAWYRLRSCPACGVPRIPSPSPAAPSGGKGEADCVTKAFEAGRRALITPPGLRGGETFARREYKLGEVCAHDKLARQCEVCERDEEIAWLKARLERKMPTDADRFCDAAERAVAAVVKMREDANCPIPMTPSQRAELRRKAERAAKRSDPEWPSRYYQTDDFAFIAAANPQAVIGMLDYIDELEQEIEYMKDDAADD